MPLPAEKKRATVTMRLRRDTRDLIDQAAAADGKSRTEFVIESARRRAIDVLLDRRLFALAGTDADAVAAILAGPPPPAPALKALLAARPS